MIRLSVSDLETYRYWKASEDSDVPTLLAKLRHEEPPTPAMEAGRAFAKLFETADAGDTAIREVDGWTFDFTAIDAEIAVPPVRELKAEVLFATPHGPVTLVGKVDGLDGLTVHDQKLTERWEAERYIDSLQWRAYLVMFDAKAFVYDVFQARYAGRYVNVNAYETVKFYTYPNVRRDVERAVAELAGVVANFIPRAA